MIYVFTNNDYYFIKPKEELEKINYFKKILQKRNDIGKLCNPIFLQDMDSIYFSLIYNYTVYYSVNKKFLYDNIIINDLYHDLDEWEIKYINNIKKQNIDIELLCNYGIKYNLKYNFIERIKYFKKILDYKKNYKIE